MITVVWRVLLLSTVNGIPTGYGDYEYDAQLPKEYAPITSLESSNKGKSSVNKWTASFGTPLQPVGGSSIEYAQSGYGFGRRPTTTTIAPPWFPPPPDEALTAQIKPDPSAANDPERQAKLVFSRDLFHDPSGDILYYAVIIVLAPYEATPPSSGLWDGSTWPRLCSWREATANQCGYYQTTTWFWAPFPGPNDTQAEFTIGDKHSAYAEEYFNGPLHPGTEYGIKVRALTRRTYQDTEMVRFRTLSKVNTVLLGTIVACVIVLVIVIGVLFRLSRGHLKDLKALRAMRANCGEMPVAVSRHSFPKYTSSLLNTEGKLTDEYQLLGTLSSDVVSQSSQGEHMANRAKNRYNNIVPFDVNRVVLEVINGDPSSDYINASFIKGYNKKVEYIACQGPKKDTCQDFWRMVLEHNVGLVIMLTQLIEQGKEKCSQYYPETQGESVSFGDVDVHCLSLVEDDLLTKRTIKATRGPCSGEVVHLHYKDWNDFGTPETTSTTLALCDLMRIHAHRGLIAVHCSAGVGRTGTLIAVDMLLMQVQANQKMNVFDTVLLLRTQRVNMVQTESQYEHIYRCIMDSCKRKIRKTKSIVDD